MAALEEGYQAYQRGEWDTAEKIFLSEQEDLYRIALAYLYMDRNDGKEDPQQSFRIFQELAEQENLIACTDLGFCYAVGIGCEVNPELSFVWYKRAAEAGFARAMNNLAMCFLQAIGTGKDPSAAVFWLEKCRDEKDGMMMNNLGCAYLDSGEETKGIQCLCKAAELGDSHAIRRLQKRGVDVSGYTEKEVDFGAILFSELLKRKAARCEGSLFYKERSNRGSIFFCA